MNIEWIEEKLFLLPYNHTLQGRQKKNVIVFLAECVPALVCNESVTKNKRRMGRNPAIYVHSVLGQRLFAVKIVTEIYAQRTK